MNEVLKKWGVKTSRSGVDYTRFAFGLFSFLLPSFFFSTFLSVIYLLPSDLLIYLSSSHLSIMHFVLVSRWA